MNWEATSGECCGLRASVPWESVEEEQNIRLQNMPLWILIILSWRQSRNRRLRRFSGFLLSTIKQGITFPWYIRLPCTRKRRTFLSPEMGHGCRNESLQTNLAKITNKSHYFPPYASESHFHNLPPLPKPHLPWFYHTFLTYHTLCITSSLGFLSFPMKSLLPHTNINIKSNLYVSSLSNLSLSVQFRDPSHRNYEGRWIVFPPQHRQGRNVKVLLAHLKSVGGLTSEGTSMEFSLDIALRLLGKVKERQQKATGGVPYHRSSRLRKESSCREGPYGELRKIPCRLYETRGKTALLTSMAQRGLSMAR